MYRINLILDKNYQQVLKQLKKKMGFENSKIIEVALDTLKEKLEKVQQVNYRTFFKELLEKTEKQSCITDQNIIINNVLQEQL